MRELPSVPVRMDYFALKGGLNLTTPPLTMPPGYAISVLNFECDINGGYARTTGYERYDGQASPSMALFDTIPCSTIGTWAQGDPVTGANSGATAVYIAQTDAGIIVTKTAGTFEAETLNGGGGVATGAQYAGGAPTSALEATFKNLAADQYRADILEVPGSGGILGVVRYKNVTYAFRNNLAGLAAELYKSSAAGWVAVPLGRELPFTSGGTYEIAEGDTITGATSGATAVVTRVAAETGSWAAGDAVGSLIFASQTGTFVAENIDVGANLNVATIAANSATITLAPNGRYEFDIHNFGGAANTTRVYGASGVHRGFEFDGTVFVPINTGVPVDTPSFVVAHSEQLFFAFGASSQHSAPGAPYVFSAVFGASEIAVGDTITGYMVQPGDVTTSALLISTRNRAFVLYGNDSADWNLVVLQPDAGAIAYTMQHLSGSLALDDRGVTYIGTSQNYGNFAHNTISNLIQPFVRAQRTLAISSCRIREKNQYRLFFSDKQGLHITMNGNKLVGMMPVGYAHVVSVIHSTEDTGGDEVVFFGSDNGFVYQMEKGTSHDGEPIVYTLTLAYNNQKSPQLNKRWRKLVLEVSGQSYGEMTVGYQLGYNSASLSQPQSVTTDTGFAAAFWDSFIWDEFFWDGQTLIPKEFALEGTAENIAIAITGNSDEFGPFTITGALLHFTPRTRIR